MDRNRNKIADASLLSAAFAGLAPVVVATAAIKAVKLAL